MRGAVVLLPLILWACDSEPSFDERYDKAQTQIRDQAKEIDAELAKRERAQRLVAPSVADNTDSASEKAGQVDRQDR